MWTRLARPEARRAVGNLLGLDPALLAALDEHTTDEPRVMAWLVGSCCLSIVGVASSCALALRACGLGVGLIALGTLFAALCTLNLMRLVHACAGLATELDEELLAPTRRPALVPELLLIGVGAMLSQAACAALLGGGLSLSRAWQRPGLALLVSLVLTVLIAAPALVRMVWPAAARTFEHAQREAIERRIAAQRDTCAELCDTLIAYELDRLEALSD